MKHAYLIMAHNNFDHLEKLIKQLDCREADIYIHIDKKSSTPPFLFNAPTNYSKIQIFNEIDVRWGGYSQIDTELLLLKKATENHYDYYHLISGEDFPIKSMDEIHLFFQENKGKNYVHFDENVHRDWKEVYRRVALYHWFEGLNRDKNFFTKLLRKSLIALQILLGVDRKKHSKFKVFTGANWFSITHDLASDLCDNEKWIYDNFKYSKCGDELFIQTFLMKNVGKYDLVKENFRYVKWSKENNGSPDSLNDDDLEHLLNSNCFFARKFTNHEVLVNTIIDRLKK